MNLSWRREISFMLPVLLSCVFAQYRESLKVEQFQDGKVLAEFEFHRTLSDANSCGS
jgi:hypothetical protein